MSQHTYTVQVDANSDIRVIMRDDNISVPWADADFQAWNSVRPTPYTLSNRQQIIQTLRAMSYAQWQANVTPAQKDRILYELVQGTLDSDIV